MGGRNLVGSIFCAWCRHETAAEDAAVLPSLTHCDASGAACNVLFVGSVRPVYCDCCLSQFQICVCVSGLVHGLPVIKFSLCQSASTVTNSLSSSAGASCQSVKKNATSSISYIGPALRHNRDFNIATAQRPREAMQVFIQINEICSL